MKSFSGKVAAITGAGSGMGRSLAIALARQGCEVALSDIDERTLAETAGLVKDVSSVRVTRKRVDVAKRDESYAWAADVVRDHGRVNLVFNNAGISYAATAWGAADEEYERIMDICYWGPVHGTRAFLPHLKASGEGHVINTSSVFGMIAFPGQATYNSAKFAVRGFTEALRLELEIVGSCVSATSVHPGGIKTNIARASKAHASLRELGIEDIEKAGLDFEKAFRTSADDAAKVILAGVRKNKRRVLIGFDAHVIDWMQRILPGRYHGLVARLHRRVTSAQRARARKEDAASPEKQQATKAESPATTTLPN